MHFNPDRYPFPDNDVAWIIRANTALDRLRAHRVGHVKAADYPGSSSAGLAAYRQLWLYRMVSILESACLQWNANRPLGTVALMRALIETVASFHYVMYPAMELLQKGELFGFHDRVGKAMFGSRLTKEERGEMPESTNVLTLVDRLERTIPCRRIYDTLCEMVHPNLYGVATFGTPNPLCNDWTFEEVTEALTLYAGAVIPVMGLVEFAAVGYEDTESKIMPLVQSLERKYGPKPENWPRM